MQACAKHYFWLMLSTYVGYFTGKQCWYDSSGAFLKWLRHLRKSTKDLRHLKIEELSGSCQETIITCHMHAGWWVKNMNNKLKVETRWQKWNLTLWFKTSVARKGDTWHTHVVTLILWHWAPLQKAKFHILWLKMENDSTSYHNEEMKSRKWGIKFGPNTWT